LAADETLPEEGGSVARNGATGGSRPRPVTAAGRRVEGDPDAVVALIARVRSPESDLAPS
jgi:hypothetical protein